MARIKGIILNNLNQIAPKERDRRDLGKPLVDKVR